MQQWEYRTVINLGGSVNVHFYTTGYIPTQLIALNGALSRLGIASWELASVCQGAKDMLPGFYFKCPIQPGRRIDDAF
jgi:hypothetical protein